MTSTFAQRLAFVRWLSDMGRMSHETDEQFATRVGVGDKWLIKWKRRETPPEGRREFTAFKIALAPMGIAVAWMYDDEGDPPEPVLWARWLARAHEIGAGG